MKDLYRRVGLQAYESSRNQILACKGDFQDTEAACSILLDQKKKSEYDRVYAALSIIAEARQRLEVRTSSRWRQTYSDFYRDSPVAVDHSQKKPVETQQSSRPVLTKLKWLAVFTGVIVSLVIAMIWLNGIPAPEKPEQRTILYKQVLDSSAEVYEAPDDESRVLAELERYDSVEVVVEKSTDEWDYVQTGNVSGYVWNEALNIGNKEKAYLENCRAMGISRPAENTTLFSLQQGTNQLTVINPLVDDAIFKLRNRLGVDVLVYYIHSNQTVTIDTVPEGTFQFRYATGKDYSPQCQRFLDGMRAMKERDYVEFSSSSWTGNGEVVKVSYVLGSTDRGYAPVPPRLF